MTEPKIVCPNGHSREFERYDNPLQLAVMRQLPRTYVDAHGKVVRVVDPNVETTTFICQDCKAQFAVKTKNGRPV